MRYILLLFLIILLPFAFARPPACYTPSPPSWVTDIDAGKIRIWPTVASSFAMFDGEDPLDGQFVNVMYSIASGTGGPNGLFGESGYNVGPRTYSAKFVTEQYRSPTQSFKISVRAEGGYIWARLVLTGETAGGSCYLYMFATYEQNSVWSQHHSSYVHVYVNGQLAYSYYKHSTYWWTQLSFYLPAGAFNVTVWVYAWSYSTSYMTNQTIWIDDLKLLPRTTVTLTSFANATHTVARWTNTFTVPMTLSVRFTASLNYGTLIDVWRSAYAPPGATVNLAEGTVEASLPTPPFAAHTQRLLLRSHAPILWATGFTAVWMGYAVDEDGGAKTYNLAWAGIWYRLSGPNVGVTVYYADGASSEELGPFAEAYIADSEPHAWINVSSPVGWVKIAAPGHGEEIKTAIPSSQQWVTFYIDDYGYGYRQIRIYTLDGRIVWRDYISPATRTVTARLTPYATYILAVWREGEERALGPFTVDKTSFTITVIPTITVAKNATTVSAHYNSSVKALIIDVFCTAPPCTVEARKGTAVFTYICEEAFCRVAWVTDDPFFEISVSDSRGARAKAYAGTTLTVPSANPFAAIVNLIVQNTGLEEVVGAGRGATFVAVLASLLIFIALSTAKEWEFGMLAFGVGLSVFPPLLGGSILPVPIGLVIALAALSLIVKKSREP